MSTAWAAAMMPKLVGAMLQLLVLYSVKSPA